MIPPSNDEAQAGAAPAPLPAASRTRTAEEERQHADWDAIAATPEFQALLRRKAVFIISGSCFFLAYYFALPVLVGWFPEWMKRPLGPINLAYAFALSQFVMAWALAAIYVKVAARWDEAAEAIIAKTRKG
ncbi:MAG TPA: DUF485 domain-containing protein [Chthoniobacteraceae bacterium]|nr:DUF485 domain-containing protein [Chthoniobacteraceae bacterium]